MLPNELLGLLIYLLGAFITGRLTWVYLFKKEDLFGAVPGILIAMLMWPIALAALILAVLCGLIVWSVTFENPFREVGR